MTGYRIISPAEDELVGSTAFYSDISFGLAQEFIDDFERCLLMIRNFPELGRSVEDDFRSVQFAKFPFALIYRIDEDGQVVIVAVSHHSRRPGYWRPRIS